MEMLERYIHEVGRRLPRKNREDVLAELRSSLQDALDDRTEGAPTEADVAALLKEFGPPKDVAASYSGDEYLIGPALYPTYMTVIKIGASVLTVLFVILTAFLWGSGVLPGDSVAESLLDMPGRLISSLLGFVGVVTVIFAVLERAGAAQEKPAAGRQDWDPRALPPATPERDRASWVGAGFSIFFDLVFLGIINLGSVPYVVNPDSPVQMFLLPIPRMLVLVLSVLLVVDIVLNVVVLARGQWEVGTRTVKLANNLLWIGAVIWAIIAYTAWVEGQVWDPPALKTAVLMVRGVLIGVAVLIAFDSAQIAFRLLTQRGAASLERRTG